MNDLCSIELLQNAVARGLSAEEESALHAHLEHCEACCAQMEQLAGGEAWQQEAAALLSADELDAAIPEPANWSEVDFSVDHLDPSDDANVLGQLGGYDVLAIVGRGGMGVVLKAFDRELKRLVAIKALAPHLAHSSVARKRFAREAQAAAAVVNPHVIAIHQVQPAGRLPFLIMPLLTGESLAQRLKSRGPLELTEVLRIGMQAAAGLAAAHDQGLVHRDVKPANIFLEKGVERVVITDFGLARAADDVSMTRMGVVAGTPEYMSPEQARGEALDSRSDLFSLGCVLYEMATGVSPFRTDSTLATLRRIVDEQPAAMASLVPELPPWFSHIVERLLSKDPAQRFASASEVSQLLEQCLSHVQQPASVPLPASLVPHAAGRRSIFNVTRKGVFAMLGTIGMTLLGMVLWQSTEAPDISGQWTSDEWGAVVLEAAGPGKYEGTFSGGLMAGPDKSRDSVKIDVPALGPIPTDQDKSGVFSFQMGLDRGISDKDKSGALRLKWSRVERRFNGTWGRDEDRHGKLSLRLVDNEIRGAWTTDKDVQKESGTPRLADLLWKRSSNIPKDAYLELSVDTELRYRFNSNPKLASPWNGSGQRFLAKADSEWKPVSRADVNKLFRDRQTILIHVQENAPDEWVQEIIESAGRRLDVTVRVVRMDSEVTVIPGPAAATGNSLQGKIQRVDAESGVAWINLGTADSVKLGMKFEVRANAIQHAKDRPPVVKGSVEVIRILDEHKSEVRILKEDSENTMAMNDVVIGVIDPKSLAAAANQFNTDTEEVRTTLFFPPIPDLTVERLREGFRQTADIYRRQGKRQVAEALEKIAASGKLPNEASHLFGSGAHAKDVDGGTIYRQVAPALTLPDDTTPSRNLLVVLRPLELWYRKDGPISKDYGDQFAQEVGSANAEGKPQAGPMPGATPTGKPPSDFRLMGDEVSVDGMARLADRHWGYVTLYEGRFNGEIIERLRHAGSIRTLRLIGTGLSGQIGRLDHVNGLIDLEITSPLTGHDLEAIGHLTRLERLSLPAGLIINVSGARELARLRNLKSLRLSSVNIDDSAFVELRPLAGLEELDLSHTRITDEGLTAIEKMPHLTTLELNRHPDWYLKQQLTDACLQSIVRLPELETLSLSGKITDAGLEQLSRLPKLKSLTLMNTEITGEGLGALKDSPVESLTLPGQLMGDPALKQLQEFRSLKRLHIIGKFLDPRDMDEWQRRLPWIDWSFSG